jgi:hypothetical protein
MKASITWGIFVVVLVGCGIVAGVVAPSSNQGFADGAALLAFVSAVALGIERVIEVLWTAIGQSPLGAWWPFNRIKKAFDTIEEQTNSLLTAGFSNAETALESVRAGLAAGDDRINDINATLGRLEAQRARLVDQMNNAQTLAPGSARLALVTDVGTRCSMLLQETTSAAAGAADDARQLLQDADTATGLALDIVASFKDNPARRIASLILGASLGLLVAGFMGLNIFVAVLGSGDAGELAGTAGILLTGLIVGLGSNPTHEVVKSLQRYKERKDAGQEIGIRTFLPEVSTDLLTEADTTVSRWAVSSSPLGLPGRRSVTIRSTD